MIEFVILVAITGILASFAAVLRLMELTINLIHPVTIFMLRQSGKLIVVSIKIKLFKTFFFFGNKFIFWNEEKKRETLYIYYIICYIIHNYLCWMRKISWKLINKCPSKKELRYSYILYTWTYWYLFHVGQRY